MNDEKETNSFVKMDTTDGSVHHHSGGQSRELDKTDHSQIVSQEGTDEFEAQTVVNGQDSDSKVRKAALAL